MRVLLTSHRYPPDGIGGVERYTQMLAAELTRAGDAVGIVTRRPAAEPTEPRAVRERLPDGTILHRFIGGGYMSLDRCLIHHRRLEQLFEFVLVETAPEVVHINHLLGLSPLFIEIAHRRGAAVVLTLHDFYFACPLVHLQKPSGELCAGPDGGRECARSCFAGPDAATSLRWGLRCGYFRRLLGEVERIICPSRHVATYFEAFGAEPGHLRVIPNGVSIPPAEPACGGRPPALGGPALSLAFLGTVVAHKGVHVILEALGRAALGPVELLVIGVTPDPEYVRRLRQLAAGIPGLEFRMYGAYRPAVLPTLLQGIDYVIVPSQVPESFSITTREALVRGIPVLVSRLGALPEAVNEGENGFTFDHDRPEQLAALLHRLAGDAGLREHLRRGARKTPVLTTTQHAVTIRAVYQEALGLSTSGSVRHRRDLDEMGFFYAELHKLAV